MTGEARYRAAGWAGHLLLASLMSTARWDVLGPDASRLRVEERRPTVFVVWHGRMIPAAYYHRHQDMAALISHSRDGEYIARVVEHWGFVPVRGSSSKGARAGLRTLVRQARKRPVVLTPDGPRGPRQTMKPGALAVARMTGLPIVPVSAGCSRPLWIEGGWDRFLVPGPFSRIAVAYGAPRRVPREAGPEDVQRVAAEVERTLNEITEQADAAVAG